MRKTVDSGESWTEVTNGGLTMSSPWLRIRCAWPTTGDTTVIIENQISGGIRRRIRRYCKSDDDHGNDDGGIYDGIANQMMIIENQY